MLDAFDHNDEVGLGEGDIHRVPHLQLPRVAPVGQVVAVRDASRAKIRYVILKSLDSKYEYLNIKYL